jgi:polyphosphate kinase
VVVEFLRQAAQRSGCGGDQADALPRGQAVPIDRALIEAAEAGKSVTAVVELKARFDEEQNLLWASAGTAGVQVIYGFIDWKTHAKVSMVVRREGGPYRTYCHFGTGNYHPVTARIYTDLSFFTADPALGRDAARCSTSSPAMSSRSGRKAGDLAAQPARKDCMHASIARSPMPRRQAGAIWAKLNALVDPDADRRLYAASKAGVEHRAWRARHLLPAAGRAGPVGEHHPSSRSSAAFSNTAASGPSPTAHALPNRRAKVYILGRRDAAATLDRRVEVLVPIRQPTVHNQVLDQVMVANLLDTEQSWLLGGRTAVTPDR